MMTAIITDHGTLFIESSTLRTVATARLYYLWCNYKSSYIPKDTFEMLDVPEYGSPEWAAANRKGVIKGMEYHVLVRTSEAVYLVRVGQSAEDAMRCAKRITRGIWMHNSATCGTMNRVDLRKEDDPNFIVTILPTKTTEEVIPMLEEL